MDDERHVVGDLTAREIEEFDNLNAGMEGSRQALAIALNFHANRASMLQLDITEWWDRIANRLGMEEVAGHRIERVRGRVSVVEMTEEEKQRAFKVLPVMHP